MPALVVYKQSQHKATTVCFSIDSQHYAFKTIMAGKFSVEVL